MALVRNAGLHVVAGLDPRRPAVSAGSRIIAELRTG
jgi:hypothetical protein